MTRTINEYNKIIKVIDSCESVEHYMVVENMLYQFADNCEKRLIKLRADAWTWGRVKKYVNYDKYISLVIDNLTNYYESIVQEYKSQLQPTYPQPSPHIVIKGFYNDEDEEYME